MSSRELLGVVFTFAIFVSLDCKVVTDFNVWYDECCGHNTCRELCNIFNCVSLKKICQYGRDGETPHFATLFDTEKRSPLVSSFQILNRGNNIKARPPFLYESQLVNPKLSVHIASRSSIHNTLTDSRLTGDVRETQALEEDYQDRTLGTYDKGHLNPAAGHMRDHELATYTYTNVVPQELTFNRHCWQYVEESIRHLVGVQCERTNHIVVGAVPSGNKLLRQRVNIPSMMWSYVECNNWAAAFIAPNLPRADIIEGKWLTVTFIKPDQVNAFLRDINYLGGLNRTGQELVLNVRQSLHLLAHFPPPTEAGETFDKLGCDRGDVAPCSCERKESKTRSRFRTKKIEKTKLMPQERERVRWRFRESTRPKMRAHNLMMSKSK